MLILAGISDGTKAFSLDSTGMVGSIWNPIRAIRPARSRTGTGFFAILTEVSVRNWPYEKELFFPFRDRFFGLSMMVSQASVPTA